MVQLSLIILHIAHCHGYQSEAFSVSSSCAATPADRCAGQLRGGFWYRLTDGDAPSGLKTVLQCCEESDPATGREMLKLLQQAKQHGILQCWKTASLPRVSSASNCQLFSCKSRATVLNGIARSQ